MPMIEVINHVQLPIALGGLPRARDFYMNLLGLEEVRHPSLDRPGTLCLALGWQRLDLREGTYTGVAPQALLALRVRHAGTLVHRLAAAGYRIQSAPLSDATPRYYVEDPFGNRLELTESEGVQLAFSVPRRAADLLISV